MTICGAARPVTSGSGAQARPTTAAAPTAHGIRFGVNAKLQAAFGVVALMTMIAAAVAIMSFSATERAFQHVSSHEVPIMNDALRLSATSGEISAAAARFVIA